MHTPAVIRWRDDNEALHFEKHGLTFGFAAGVFLDADRLVAADLRHSDPPRFNVVGCVDGVCINVTYAMDGEEAVIISARSASRKERERYATHQLD